MLLQGSCRAFDLGGSPCTGVLVGALFVILLIILTALTVLFPAVELGPIHDKFNVGMVDLYLPMDFTEVAGGDPVLAHSTRTDVTIPPVPT